MRTIILSFNLSLRTVGHLPLYLNLVNGSRTSKRGTMFDSCWYPFSLGSGSHVYVSGKLIRTLIELSERTSVGTGVVDYIHVIGLRNVFFFDGCVVD